MNRHAVRTLPVPILSLVLMALLAGCGDKVEEHADAASAARAVDAAVRTEEECLTVCRAATGKLATALKEALQKAMAEGGPTNALSVCNMEAIPIAKTISVQEGLMVSRTSLAYRNTANAPDDWEGPRLEELAARLADGEDPATLETWQVVAYPEGHHTFRYMKAIPTADMCLICHGETLAPPVADRIAELYPDDKAVGFHTGDLRGAFTLSLPLD